LIDHDLVINLGIQTITIIPYASFADSAISPRQQSAIKESELFPDVDLIILATEFLSLNINGLDPTSIQHVLDALDRNNRMGTEYPQIGFPPNTTTAPNKRKREDSLSSEFKHVTKRQSQACFTNLEPKF
jgi:hypothetical protein